MSRLRGFLFVVLAAPLCSCQSLARFDTKDGGAYCGPIVSAQFVRTLESEGGFQGSLRLRLEIDTDHLTTLPGKLTTDDAQDGPCMPRATFDRASLRVTPEVVHDALSTMTFEDGQVQNIVAWVDSTCRGPMLAVVSLLKSDRVDVRLLQPSAAAAAGDTKRDAFALFSLDRLDNGCGY
jgi:hypothetical protein